MKTRFKLKCHFIALLVIIAPNAFAKGLTSKSMLISVAVPVTAGIYSLSIDDIEGVKELGLSCLLVAQTTVLLKNTVNRQRPNHSDRYSFPSGHSSSSFVGASYLHHRYGLAWGLPMYAVATAVGVQRVNVKDHFWSDVLAGAALGYFTASFFTVEYPNVWLKPTISPSNRSVGLQFETRFN